MISVQQWATWLNQGNASIPHILLTNYKKLRLSETEMMLIVHLHSFLSEGILLPSIEQIHERMSCSPDEISRMLNRLYKERYIGVESTQDEQGRLHDSYSLTPLWEKLIRYLTLSADQEVAATGELQPWPTEEQVSLGSKKDLEADIFRRFELEFGRPLSPMECETVSMWLDKDHYDIQLIYLALREAVISNKISLRYIDRILFEWEKNGVKSIEDVRSHTKKFRQQAFTKVQGEENKIPFTFYNWLEK